MGGKTVSEAKANMSYREYLDWIRYRNKWGSLHLGMRVDRAIARPASVFARMYSKSGQVSFYDFSPHDKPKPASPQELFSYLKGVAKNGK